MASPREREDYKERMIKRAYDPDGPEDKEAQKIMYLASLFSKVQSETPLDDICICQWCHYKVTPEHIFLAERVVTNKYL